MAKYNVNIDNTLVYTLEQMAADHGLTVEAELRRCAEFGIKNLSYRSDYNRKKNAAVKDMKHRNVQLERELAELKAAINGEE